jgi:hypothetical protein
LREDRVAGTARVLEAVHETVAVGVEFQGALVDATGFVDVMSE